MEMVKEVGIFALGDRQKLRCNVDKIKQNENLTSNEHLPNDYEVLTDVVLTEHNYC